jgi:general secretion pathway protein J
MNSLSRFSSRKGMTLMEIMVSLAILSMIGAMSWTALGQTFLARDALEVQDGVRQQARIALERISRELSTAYMSGNITTPNTYKTVFVGKNEDPVDTLWFASLSHHRIYRDSRESEQTELTYWGEPDPDDRDTYVLLHREAPRIDHESDKDGTILPLAYGVQRLDFKYLDPKTNEWEEEWDSTGIDHPNIMPRAVRVVLVLEGPDAADPEKTAEFAYATTVMLEFSNEMSSSAFATGSENAVTAPAPGSNRGLPGGAMGATGMGGARGLPGSSR